MNFWESNCPPCIAEIEHLNNLYDKFKNQKNFVFISFTPDDPEIIDFLIDKFNIKFPILSLAKKYISTIKFVKGYPTNLIVNEIGQVIYQRLGGFPSKKEANKIFNVEIYQQIKRALKYHAE